MTFSMTRPQPDNRRNVLNFLAGSLWHAPGSFRMARALGPKYSLRCVLFHDVSEQESSFTQGLGSTVTPKSFEAALEFLTKHYTPVSLQDVLASFEGAALPERPVLLTFDDGYASVGKIAAPLCVKFGVPAVLFVNAACLDNRQLALDNLICYVANTCGMDTIQAAMNAAGWAGKRIYSLKEVFASFLPTVSLSARKTFRGALVDWAQVREAELASAAGLYLGSNQLRELAKLNFEIGNHTYTHVHGRPLTGDDFAEEIDVNRALLEAASRASVRSFSVPYGSSADLTPSLLRHLQQRGYEAIFLAEGRANPSGARGSHFDRVSIHASKNAAFFSEIEVLPRLRNIRWDLSARQAAQAY